MTNPRHTRITNLLANILVFCAALTLLFGILEFGSRVWLTRFADQEVFRKYASMRQLNRMDTATLEKRTETLSDLMQENLFKYVPHLYMPYVPRPDFRRGKNRHNALGFRGDEIVTPKPDGEFRIVCMGGSTTYTSFVDDYTKSYPALLQQKLHEAGYENVAVINAGAEGYTTWESLASLQFRVLDLEPDIIIVYHGINDITSRAVEPETYRGDNSGLIVAKDMEARMLPYYEHSTLIRSLLIRFGRIESHSAIASFYTWPQGRSLWWEFYNQVTQGIYPSGSFEDRTFEQVLEMNEPRYFRNNLESMVAIAKLRGITPVLATFAHSPELQPYTELSKYPAAFDAMNQVIRDIGVSLHAPVFDFAASFPGNPEFYADGVHVNERGAELKAALFAEFLIEQNLISSHSTSP